MYGKMRFHHLYIRTQSMTHDLHLKANQPAACLLGVQKIGKSNQQERLFPRFWAKACRSLTILVKLCLQLYMMKRNAKQTVFLLEPPVVGYNMNSNYSRWYTVLHRWCLTPNSSFPPFEFARDAGRNDAVRWSILQLQCMFGLRQPLGRIWKGINDHYFGLLEFAVRAPINSKVSPHFATGKGFVNGSALCDVVSMYNSFIISSSVKHS